MATDPAAEIASLKALAKESGAIAQEIPSESIVVSQWVRFKCRYGCKGYGKHLSCLRIRNQEYGMIVHSRIHAVGSCSSITIIEPYGYGATVPASRS